MSHFFDVLDTMLTSGTAVQVDDLDGETFDSALILTFIYDVINDRPSTSGIRDIAASGFGGGPR
jgi:hypothetical protein